MIEHPLQGTFDADRAERRRAEDRTVGIVFVDDLIGMRNADDPDSSSFSPRPSGKRWSSEPRTASSTSISHACIEPAWPHRAFQPARLAAVHQVYDFSLWRNIQREYSEEFLGATEHDGNSVDPIDYEHDEPFRSFSAARDAGDFRVFAVGVGLFPLELWAELLTVAVIEAPVFDRLFADMVSVNEEGAAVSTVAGRPVAGIPFTSQTHERLRSEPLSPIAQACIELAWRHRHTLLAG